MPTIGIWTWRRQQGLLPMFGWGHVELEVNGYLCCLRGHPQTEPLARVDAQKDAIFRGFVAKRTSEKIARDIENLRQQSKRYSTDDDQPPARAEVFYKEVTEDQLGCLEGLVASQAANPPHYCPTAKPNTMNCVTFVVNALKSCAVLPAEFQMDSDRFYFPTAFCNAMDGLHEDGYFLRKDVRVLDEGEWRSEIETR